MLLSSQHSVLVVVDVQERLVPVVHEPQRMLSNLQILLHAARELRVPVLVTEQYPKGLGSTLPAVLDGLAADAIVEKTCFSGVMEPVFMDRLAALGRDQIVLTGCEAHVCVLQTALGLKGQGRDVFLVADAVASRRPENATLGIERMRQNGVSVVTTEMVAFEWLERSGTPAFKSVLPLIR
jgi:nicotinamidase-related amidase